MSGPDFLQIAVYFSVLLLLAIPLGKFICAYREIPFATSCCTQGIQMSARFSPRVEV